MKQASAAGPYVTRCSGPVHSSAASCLKSGPAPRGGGVLGKTIQTRAAGEKIQFDHRTQWQNGTFKSLWRPYDESVVIPDGARAWAARAIRAVQFRVKTDVSAFTSMNVPGAFTLKRR